MDYIALCESADKLLEEKRYSECIDMIEKQLPEETGAEKFFPTALRLGEAYIYKACLEENPPALRDALDCWNKAVWLLTPWEDRGKFDLRWNKRMAYVHWFDKNSEGVLKHAKAWFDMDPDARRATRLIADRLKWQDETEALLPRQQGEPQYYTPRQEAAVEEHINRCFGWASVIFHDTADAIPEIDIYPIPPSRDRPYYTLVTKGMGAYRMNLPKELLQEDLDRAELVICLPPDWQLSEEALNDAKWNWPIRLLRSTARLPYDENTWLGWGHSVGTPSRSPYHDSVGYCGAVLYSCGAFPWADSCALPEGGSVNFYQLIPLYSNEIDYKLEHGADALLDLFPSDFLTYCSPDRDNVVEKQEEIRYNRRALDIDDRHILKINEMRLPVDVMNVYNHMAAFLRWAVANFLTGADFDERYPELVKAIREDTPFDREPDLRLMIRYDEGMRGMLHIDWLCDQGQDFARRYFWGVDRFPYNYFADTDDYALKRLGVSRWQDKSYRDEEYLFVPYDERYCRDMAKTITQRYEMWLGGKELWQRPKGPVN